MTADKDFKRFVRAKARAYGLSYAAALQRLRNITAPRGGAASTEDDMNIVRTIPDIRSLDMAASRAFYEGLLGFLVAMEHAGMLIFANET